MWIVIGATILFMGFLGMVNDPVYSNMGFVLIVIGSMQVFKNIRYHVDKEFREKTDIAYNDERNAYIRMKAWSWAGYLFFMGAAITTIALHVAKMTLYGQIVGYCMCALLVFYWVSYMFLSKKY